MGLPKIRGTFSELPIERILVGSPILPYLTGFKVLDTWSHAWFSISAFEAFNL